MSKFYSEKELEKMLYLFNESVSLKDLAYQLDRSARGIMKKMKHLSLEFPEVWNSEKVNIYCREWYDIEGREYRKKYKETNREIFKAINKKYKETHRDVIRKQRTRHRIRHKDKISEYQRNYRKTHRENFTRYKRDYRKNLKNKIRKLVNITELMNNVGSYRE